MRYPVHRNGSASEAGIIYLTFTQAALPKSNRGVEVTPAVADGPHSAITEQVTNGVAVRMAVLYLLAGSMGLEESGGEE